MRRFFFHFNKPASKAAGKPRISVHHSGQCLIVDNVVCRVPIAGRIRAKQPMFVMTGRGNVRVENEVAYIER